MTAAGSFENASPAWCLLALGKYCGAHHSTTVANVAFKVALYSDCAMTAAAGWVLGATGREACHPACTLHIHLAMPHFLL